MRVAEISNKILASKVFKLCFFVLCFAILFAKSDRSFGWTNPEARRAYPVLSDGSGYYAYLPQWFTFGTDKFQFADSISKTYPRNRFVEFAGIPASPGDHYNKYYPGAAVCLSPFYLAAKVHASISGHRNDGYSWPFLLWCNLGMIFFALVGSYGMFRIFELFRIKPFMCYLGVSVVLFGTNLNYYTTVEIPFSHVFCFAVNAWIIFHAKRWADNNTPRNFYWICALLGLAVIIRPTTIFVLAFIPFLFPTFKSFFLRLKELILSRRKQLLIGAAIGLSLIAFLIWNAYGQTGNFVVNSYSGERFENWKDPYIFDVLFSYRKGLFVYTPVLLLLFPALLYCFFKERKVFWGTLLIFMLVTYSTAAWWIWWFGGGLGARNFIDFFAVFFLAIALLYQSSHVVIKVFFILIFTAGTWIYQIYDYQMRYSIIHYSEVPKEKFWDVFLKTDHRFMWYMAIPFDEEPVNARYLKSSFYLVDRNNFPVKSKVVELQWQLFEDDPKFGIRSKLISTEDKKIGIHFQTDIRIYDHFTNPAFYLFAFRNGSIIEKKSVQFGGMIPDEDEFASPELYLNLKSKWNEVDSVAVWFDQSLGNVAVKNQKVQFYAY